MKKVRAVKKLIYYCIDYYIPQGKFSFNDLFLRVISVVDKFTLKNADFIWDISPNIAQYRREVAGISIDGCRNRVVPLGYSRHLRRFKRIDEIDRWVVGFVGTITAGQGLQLLIEALPEILRQLPQVRLKIIGQGPYSGELKAMVNQRGLAGAVDFLGFIQDEARMLDLLSSCAIGVALWGGGSGDRNIVCADPGKTKLYAFLGMPMLVTNACPLSQEIARYKAGEVIAYDKPGLISAIERILGDEQALEEYKNNSFRMGEEYVADGIFSSALESVMEKRF